MNARNSAAHFFLPSLGLAVLFAAIFFGNTARAQEPVPTPDRLAEPTLPAVASQADHGAQVYWLSCLPCHGDRGQGLTDEFRQVYPPEEQNCWESGCHGPRPYDNGFTLPTKIPAVVGESTLQKFSNAAVLRAYILAAMPYWKPGSLTEEQSWQVTAFLLRENGLWSGQEELNVSRADQVRVSAPTVAPSPQTEPISTAAAAANSDLLWTGVAALGIILVLLLFLRLVRSHKPPS